MPGYQHVDCMYRIVSIIQGITQRDKKTKQNRTNMYVAPSPSAEKLPKAPLRSIAPLSILHSHLSHPARLVCRCSSTASRVFCLPSDTDDLRMPMPEASAVVVKVTHPCYVSVLRAKLHRSLDIPLEDIRYRKGGVDITCRSPVLCLGQGGP